MPSLAQNFEDSQQRTMAAAASSLSAMSSTLSSSATPTAQASLVAAGAPVQEQRIQTIDDLKVESRVTLITFGGRILIILLVRYFTTRKAA